MKHNLQMEQRSLVMVHAVAAAAGFHVVMPEFDRPIMDGAILGTFGRRPRIEFCVKATSRDVFRGESLRLPISIREYNELRMESWAPRILIAVVMPVASEPWLSQNSDGVWLQSSAYWVSLEGRPQVPNADIVTISIPASNVFDSVQLQALMNRAETGSPL